ncbi:hypothetical protein ACFLX4_04130 [Chloroflexota bacterium]
MRQLVTIRRLIEDEGINPDSTYVDPEDVVELEEDEDQEEE